MKLPVLIVAAVFINNVVVTAYRSVPSQTDDSPNFTSIGEHCNVHGVAVSRDLLARWGGPLHYGDLVYIDGIGYKFVNDCMAPRYHRHIDVWVEEKADERKFEHKWREQRRALFLLKQKGTWNESN